MAIFLPLNFSNLHVKGTYVLEARAVSAEALVARPGILHRS